MPDPAEAPVTTRVAESVDIPPEPPNRTGLLIEPPDGADWAPLVLWREDCLAAADDTAARWHMADGGDLEPATWPTVVTEIVENSGGDPILAELWANRVALYRADDPAVAVLTDRPVPSGVRVAALPDRRRVWIVGLTEVSAEDAEAVGAALIRAAREVRGGESVA